MRWTKTYHRVLQTAIAIGERANDRAIVLAVRNEKLQRTVTSAIKLMEMGRIQAALDKLKKGLEDDNEQRHESHHRRDLAGG